MHTEYPPGPPDDPAPDADVVRLVGFVVLGFAGAAVLLLVAAFVAALAAVWTAGDAESNLLGTALLLVVAAIVSGALSPVAGRLLASEDGPR